MTHILTHIIIHIFITTLGVILIGFPTRFLFPFPLSKSSIALTLAAALTAALAIDGLPKLREFATASAWLSPALLKHLPASVEHLAFGVSALTPLRALAENMDAWKDAKAALKVAHNGLTVSVFANQQQQQQGGAAFGDVGDCMRVLGQTCASAGAELRTFERMERFMAQIVCSFVFT